MKNKSEVLKHGLVIVIANNGLGIVDITNIVNSYLRDMGYFKGRRCRSFSQTTISARIREFLKGRYRRKTTWVDGQRQDNYWMISV